MPRYLMLGAAIGIMTWLQLLPPVRTSWLALPRYTFILTLAATLVAALLAWGKLRSARNWQRLAKDGLDKLARQLSAPVGVTLGLGGVAALHAFHVSSATGTSAGVALICFVMSLSFAGLALNLRHLASAWRA